MSHGWRWGAERGTGALAPLRLLRDSYPPGRWAPHRSASAYIYIGLFFLKKNLIFTIQLFDKVWFGHRTTKSGMFDHLTIKIIQI
jgi:hypothetical protein